MASVASAGISTDAEPFLLAPSIDMLFRVAARIVAVGLSAVAAVWLPPTANARIVSSEDPMVRIFSAEASNILRYTCVATAETTEAIATPITDPAMPIRDASNMDVTAASAPAPNCAMESPSNRLSFFGSFSVLRASDWRT